MQKPASGMGRRDFLRKSLIGAGSALLAAGPLASLAISSTTGKSSTAPVTLQKIKAASALMPGNVVRTPIVSSGILSKEYGAEIFFKLENQQYTGAFKERGALNKLSSLTSVEKAKGVIAASAGNHSQGVARHATRLGIRSVIAMPHGTPNTKVARTRSLGAEVIVTGADFDEALAFALDKAAKEGLTFIHPFDDPMVIAGQGTVALEMLQDVPELDILLVPVGGGGLISGCVTAAKSIKPGIKVYGVETEQYPAMHQRLQGQPVKCGSETIAEGLAVHNVGALPYSIVKRLADGVLVVKESSIEQAVVALFNKQKIVAEGAGAVGLAAIMEHPERFAGKKVGTPVTGGNIAARLFSNLLQRDLAHGGQLVKLRVISQGHGDVYPEIAAMVAESEATVVDVQFDRVFHAASAKSPAYHLILETKDHHHAEQLVKKLQSQGLVAILEH